RGPGDVLDNPVGAKPHRAADKPRAGGARRPARPARRTLPPHPAAQIPGGVARGAARLRAGRGRRPRAARAAPHLRLAAGARRHRPEAGADVARPPDPPDDDALRPPRHTRPRSLPARAGAAAAGRRSRSLTGGQTMNIKSLILGSAVSALAVTGAKAADAIIIAEPEPVEYVRVCD